MIFGVDNLEALNNGKVMARLRLSGRQIVLHGARPLFHHHKLLKARRLRPIMADAKNLARAATHCRCGFARAQKIRGPRSATPL